MPHKRKQLPKYCKHKSSGRAFVRIGGKMYYPGKYGSDASRREYGRIIAEFVANGRQALYDPDEKTLQYITDPQIRDMVRVQRLISGRPQDIHNMRLCDINQSGEVWKYTPFAHKTKYKGKVRELPIGPKAQQILLPYLDACKENPEQFVFPRPEVRYYHHHYTYVSNLYLRA